MARVPNKLGHPRKKYRFKCLNFIQPRHFSYRLIVIYVSTRNRIATVPQKVVTTNSPNTSPRKNGAAFRKPPIPPCFVIIHFRMKLIRIENQKKFIVKVLVTAYPAEWNGIHIHRARRNAKRTATPVPTLIALSTAVSGPAGWTSRLPSRLKVSLPAHAV